MSLAIIGQGLAGCCLAWELEWAGADFSVHDEPRPEAASRVAGGMVNPVNGQNYTLAWRVEEELACATAFYQRVEAVTGGRFWHPLPIVRLVSEKEWRKVEPKLDDPQLAAWVDSVEELAGDWRAALTVRGGGRLAVKDFCEATAAAMAAAGRFRSPTVEDRRIYCEGAAGLIAGKLGGHRCAKGEILTLRADWPQDRILVGGGGWLVPMGNGLFKAGATYSWDRLDGQPTAEGLATVRRLIERIAGLGYEVVDHQAGIRPIVRRSRPVAGALADGTIVLNGLGSKGSLYAPGAAANLAGWLLRGEALDPELDVKNL